MNALIAHFQRMAQYNRVANGLLYDAIETLPPSEYAKPREAFFGSIQGALNHIIVGDRIWLDRFEGRVALSTDLDAIPYPAFDDLRAARAREDGRIDAMSAGLTASFLNGDLTYVNNQNRDMTDPAAVCVAHFFNHQTHHRGQVHGMLSQTDTPPPSLDMHRCLNP